MAYIFDPIRNTFIDDEDKSLGNKLALNDEEIDKVIKQIDDKFGPGTVVPASSLPENKPAEVETTEAFNRFNSMYEDGGRVNLQNGTPGKSAFRKPYAPEIEQRIIELHQNNKLGAKAIAEKLTKEFGIKFSRAPIGKRITALKAEGLIKEIPYSEREAAIKQRGEFYGKPASEKYLAIREVRDQDRKIQFRNEKNIKAGKGYNIPSWAKFKIDFKNPVSSIDEDTITEVPEKFRGVQYYRTKKAAEKALEERKKLILQSGDETTEAAQRAADKRKKRLKTVGDETNISGVKRFPFHHIRQIGGIIPLTTDDVAIINQKVNASFSGVNKKLNNLADDIAINNRLALEAKSAKNEAKSLAHMKEVERLNNEAESIVKNKINKLPKEYKKLIGFNKFTLPTDEYGLPIEKEGYLVEKVGGSDKRGGKPLIDLTTKEIKNLKKQITADSKALSKATLKDKILSTTGKVIKGAGKVIKPVGYAMGANALAQAIGLAEERGIELTNLDKFMALDSGDPEVALNNAMRRMDADFAAQERAKDLAKMSDDFEEVALKKGGPVELSPMPRIGFENGGAVGADDDFAKELEYYFLNEDAELPKIQSYKESMNPVEALNDMIDPRNYQYYADLLVRSGLRVGEFGVRILPALGKLGSDLLTKPAFRVTGTKKTGYVQDYEDIPGTGVGLAEGLKLEGTGIFQDFLKNITPTSMEKKVGLDKLIEAEEQKQKDRRSTIAPKVLGDVMSLGAEVTAPVFPGLRLLRAFAADRKLPVDDVTRKVMEKEIDEALDARGISRRDFMKVAGAGGAVMVAKMLGVNLAKAPKVAEKVVSTGSAAGKPVWFDALVNKVVTQGEDVTKQVATLDRMTVHRYNLGADKSIEVTQDLTTGNVKVTYYSPDNMAGESLDLNYTAPEILEDGTRVPADFKAIELEPRGVRSGPDDYDVEFDGENVVENVDDLNSEMTTLKEFATGQLDEADLKIKEEKIKKVQQLNEDQQAQAEYLEEKYGPGNDGYYENFSDE